MKNKRGVIAVAQILILMLGTIAIAWAIGSEVPLISAPAGPYDQGTDSTTTPEEVRRTPDPQARPPTIDRPSPTGDFDGAGLDITGESSAYITSGQYARDVAGTPAITNIPGREAASRAIAERWGYSYDPSTNTIGAGEVRGMRNTQPTVNPRDGLGGGATNTLRETAGGGASTQTTQGKGIIERIFGVDGAKKGTSYFIDSIISSAAWGVTAYYIVGLIGPMFSENEAGVRAAQTALGWGIGTGRFVYTEIANQKGLYNLLGGKGGEVWGMDATTAGWGAGIIVTVAIFIMLYKSETTEIVTFECKPWDAPTKGDDCDKCNKQGILPCSEYQCRSLGQACKLVNDEESGEPLCAWVHDRDVKPPEIRTWDEALLADYKYNPDNTISPPDKGSKIIYTPSTTGCVKAFTPFTFGIETNEPSRCKLDYVRRKNFDEMQFFVGGNSLFRYNHTQAMSLPGPSALNGEAPVLENDGEYEVYIRCMDANENTNPANFVLKYCVEKGPDTTPPLIVTTSLLNGMPIAFEQENVDLDVYVNEPASCKWSTRDQSYDDMETDMSCSTSVFEMNAQMLYKCQTTLSGLKDRVENKFYFRCKDQPRKTSDRNVNSQSYEFSLMGTEPVYIDWVKPNETIKDSTDIVKVKLEARTSHGHNEGEASCYYSDTGEEDSYILFGETGTHQHSQELNFAEGSYEYHIKCVDLGGNSDEKVASFDVETDSDAPVVVRAYHTETFLKLITDEEAECVYGTDTCDFVFDDGATMQDVDDVEHYVDWETDITYHIKCRDGYGNQPIPKDCSIIVRPSENFPEEEEED